MNPAVKPGETQEEFSYIEPQIRLTPSISGARSAICPTLSTALGTKQKRQKKQFPGSYGSVIAGRQNDRFDKAANPIMRTSLHQVSIMAIAIAISMSDLPSAHPAIIKHTIVYTRLTDFSQSQNIGQMKMSAQGGKIVFSTTTKKIFTLNTDGTGLTEVFDYTSLRTGCPCLAPFVDISGDGSKIIWTDTLGEIFVSNADGTSRQRIATEFKGPNLAVSGPVIRVQPRLTADGTRVIFANSLPEPGRLALGWQDFAGVWSINSDGSGQTQLVSYNQLSREILGKDGSEYNPNVAFNPGFDVSDDGSRIVFSTTQDLGAIVALEGGVLRKLAATPVGGARSLSINGAGTQVAYVPQTPDSSEKVFTVSYTGGTPLPLAEIGLGGLVQMTRGGEKVLALSTGTALPLMPVSLLNTDGSGRWDVVILSCYAAASVNPFAAAGMPSVSADGRRIAFLSDLDLPQIWIADIDPTLAIGAPSITSVAFSPSFVLADGSTASSITAAVTPGANPVERVCVDPMKDGATAPNALSNTELFDNGSNGDKTSNDGVYSNNTARRTYGSPGNYTLRVNAFAGRRITSVDAEPFAIRTTAPVEPVTEIHRAVELRWGSERGLRYQAFRSLDLGVSFERFGSAIDGTGDFISVFDTTRENAKAFYQIRLAD